MKFQICILLNFERTHGWMDGRMEGWKNGRAKSNMPLQLFQSWRHSDNKINILELKVVVVTARLGRGWGLKYMYF